MKRPKDSSFSLNFPGMFKAVTRGRFGIILACLLCLFLLYNEGRFYVDVCEIHIGLGYALIDGTNAETTSEGKKRSSYQTRRNNSVVGRLWEKVESYAIAGISFGFARLARAIEDKAFELEIRRCVVANGTLFYNLQE